MSAWHGIYADVLRQRFSALAAYGVALTGDRDAGLRLAQRAMETVFSRARAPQGVPQAEGAVRREMVRVVVADAGAGSGSRPGAAAGLDAETRPDAGAGLDADRAEPRGSLASLSPPERAAAVLFAVDGLDDRAIRRALGRRAVGRRTPSAAATTVSLATADELRAVYVTEAARPVIPAGGATGAIATSRRARREALVRRGVLTGTAAVAVIAVGLSAAQAINLADARVDASPSPQMSMVAWDPGTDLEAAVAGLALPACGDVWIPGPQSVHGITPVVTVEEESGAGGRDTWVVRQTYDYGETPEVPLLYVPGLVVVTLDDRVVHTRDLTANPPVGEDVEYSSPMRRTSAGEISLNRLALCDAQAAWDAAGFNDVDWDALSQDQRNALIAERRAFRAQWSHMEPGTYRIYSVAPMMFGEQVALAQLVTRMGVPSLSNLRWYLTGSQLSNDPRISPYCSQRQHDDDWDEPECDPPASVLKEVLTREVDVTTVNDWEPGVGISEPVVLVVQ